MSAVGEAVGRVRWPTDVTAILTAAGAAVLLVTAIVVGQTSLIGLAVVGAGLAVLVAVASLRWPRTVIVLVVLSPILDRYVLDNWLPVSAWTLSHFISEALLVAVGLALGIQAWRRGLLIPAIWHPTTIGLVAFVLVALVSALVNAVPPEIVAIGLTFTLDAAACFYLPRLVGFSLRQSLFAVAAVLVIVFISAFGGLAQWILAPDFLGLEAWQGVYGEVYRLASIFTDPNTFGALLIAAIPFAAFTVTSLDRRPGVRLAAVIGLILLFMPLLLSFSRGAWGGLIVGGGLALAFISWRTLLIASAIGAVSLAMALTVPRMVLVAAPSPAAPNAPQPQGPPQQPSLIDSTIARINEISAGKDLRTLFVANGLPIVLDHPVLGVGPGRYGGAAAYLFGTPVYEEYATTPLFENPEQRTVDNFWLHILIETGVLGIAAFVAAALAAWVPILRTARHSRGWNRVLLGGIAGGTAAMGANAVTTMLLEANSVAFIVWFLLGLGTLAVAAQRAREREGSPGALAEEAT